MPQDSVIRSDAPHTVNMAEGGGPALSKKGTTDFGEARVQVASDKTRAVVDAVETHRAQYEEHIVVSPPSTWAVRPARITHVGRPRAKRVDFRGEMRALRLKNAEVRDRLNRLLGAPQSLKKAGL